MRRAFTNCQLLKIRTNVLDHGLFLKVLFVFSALNLVFKWLSTQDILMATRFRIAQPSTQRCYTDIEDLTSPIIPASQLLYDIVLLDQCCTNVCTTPCNYTGTRSAIWWLMIWHKDIIIWVFSAVCFWIFNDSTLRIRESYFVQLSLLKHDLACYAQTKLSILTPAERNGRLQTERTKRKKEMKESP